MSRSIIHVFTCDRCERKHHAAELHSAWATIQVKQINGPIKIGDHDKPRDICPDCLRDVIAWWTNKDTQIS